MALYCDLPVYKVGNELYMKFVLARRTLPREERYTIGQELDRAMVDVLVLVYRINSTRDKVPLIARARQLVVEIQVRTRVLRDIRALSVGHFTELFDLSENLAKQLASWQKFSVKSQGREWIEPQAAAPHADSDRFKMSSTRAHEEKVISYSAFGLDARRHFGIGRGLTQESFDANVPSGSGGRPESAGSRFGGARQKANPMRECAASSASPDNGDPTANTEVTS